MVYLSIDYISSSLRQIVQGDVCVGSGRSPVYRDPELWGSAARLTSFMRGETWKESHSFPDSIDLSASLPGRTPHLQLHLFEEKVAPLDGQRELLPLASPSCEILTLFVVWSMWLHVLVWRIGDGKDLFTVVNMAIRSARPWTFSETTSQVIDCSTWSLPSWEKYQDSRKAPE